MKNINELSAEEISQEIQKELSRMTTQVMEANEKFAPTGHFPYGVERCSTEPINGGVKTTIHGFIRGKRVSVTVVRTHLLEDLCRRREKLKKGN